MTGKTSPRNTLFRRVTLYSVRQPKRVLAIWALALVVFGIAGIGIDKLLVYDELAMPGTEATRALKLEKSKFGHPETLVSLLRGKSSDLRRYGPRAVRAANKVKGVTAFNPWSQNAPKSLLPAPDKALILIKVNRGLVTTGTKTLPEVKQAMRRVLPPRVSQLTSGAPEVAKDIITAIVGSGKKVEKVAMPFLLLVLLLIFRSPVAAAMPLVLGVSVIIVYTGVLGLLARFTSVDHVAATLGSTLGLALGVDYSLLIVSRFREELAARGSPDEAALATVSIAGRTVAAAGVIVASGMTLLLVILPNSLSLTSEGFGIALAAMLAVVGAITLMPASLTLLGPNINRWSISRKTTKPRIAPFVRRVTARPTVVTAIALVPLLALSNQALGLKTGTSSTAFLPSNSPSREAFTEFTAQLSPGWGSPYTVLVSSNNGPVTSARKLAAIANFQKRLERDPGVTTVIGPSLLARSAREASGSMLNSQSQLARLDSGLGKAARGVGSLRAGLASARNGSGALAAGSNQTLAGSNSLQQGITQASIGINSLNSGLGKTRAGSARLTAALAQVRSGTTKLKTAAARASLGAQAMAGPSGAFKEALRNSSADFAKLKEVPASAQKALQQAKSALDLAPLSMKADSHYQDAYQQVVTALAGLSGYQPLSGEQLQQGYFGVSAALERAQKQSAIAASQAKSLSQGADQLSSGLQRLDSGNSALAQGTGKTLTGAKRLRGALTQATNGTARLSQGTRRLSGGAGQLSGGIRQLSNGAGQLNHGLASGYRRSAALDSGLKRMHEKVSSTRSQLSGNSAGAGRVDTKRVAKSGYMTLAALDGTSPDVRANVGSVVNIHSGGDIARLLVVPSNSPTDKEAAPFTRHLRTMTADLGKNPGLNAMLGGRATMIQDYNRLTGAKRVPVIVAISLISLIFLIVVFRSILLAVKAVVLNLLTVGAAFGVIELLWHGANPVGGGEGWMDCNSFFTAYLCVFLISMDYEIFMVNRIREGYQMTGDNEKAIDYGISKTANIITGAAAVMLVIFLTLGALGLTTLRQFGLAMAVAVFVDATLVRLILLPASMRLFGKANWWIPRWLERLLPEIHLEAETPDSASASEPRLSS